MTVNLTGSPSPGPATPRVHTTPSTAAPTPAPQPAAQTSEPASTAKSAYPTWAPTASPTPTARSSKRTPAATSTSATSSATPSPSSVHQTAPRPVAPPTSSVLAPRALPPYKTASVRTPPALVDPETQDLFKAPPAPGLGVTPVRHQTHSSHPAPAPHIPTLTMTVRLWDRLRALSSAVLAPLVVLRARRVMASLGTTSQTVTHLALLALRAVRGVCWSEGGRRKSKLALAR